MFAIFVVISPRLLENQSDFKISSLDTNFGFNFLISTEQKCFIFRICVQFESTFQISNFTNLTNF